VDLKVYSRHSTFDITFFEWSKNQKFDSFVRREILGSSRVVSRRDHNAMCAQLSNDGLERSCFVEIDLVPRFLVSALDNGPPAVPVPGDVYVDLVACKFATAPQHNVVDDCGLVVK
jgi:hypothetical protein